MPTLQLSPTVEEYIFGINNVLRLLLVETAWTGALIPLLILLFFLSTPAGRRKPIFIMNAFAVVMGIGLGSFNIHNKVTAFKLHPGNPRKTTLLAHSGMLFLMPVAMDCILAYRLTAVYPRHATPNHLLATIFVPIALFKVTRIINLAIFLKGLSNALAKSKYGPSISPGDFESLWNVPYLKVEWVLQVIDNSFEQLYISVFPVAVVEGPITRKDLQGYIIIQLIIIFTHREYLLVADILVTNLYFEIVCVVFATIWAMKTSTEVEAQVDRGTYPPGSTDYGGDMVFALPTESGGTGSVEDGNSIHNHDSSAHFSRWVFPCRA
ncbi:hypothetical protein D9757_013655 [Collybiopsis confluens]|uniref:Uncharacterized protein n=1 Tax=Collybiopsis confluens TaxID=2823264 RepID=A0A8H5CSP6_9AGAR|nr:hypothetical protein D9757_013655 [Collybiopsis confluens]